MRLRANHRRGGPVPRSKSSLSSISSRTSALTMDSIVTLHQRFSRDASSPPSTPSTTSPPQPGAPDSDTVSMSHAGQIIIPATFKLVPISSQPAHPDLEHIHQPFQQAAGHNGSFRIQGPTLIKHVTDREASFYEDAAKGLWPTSLLPKYHGRVENDAINIENLTFDCDRPCVIDLKMGVQTVESEDASLFKRLKMSALDIVTRSKSAGCRLEGLSMYRTLENRRINGTKIQSHSVSANIGVTLQDVLTFFLTDESGVRTDIALRFQHHVEEILRQFEKNDKLRFIGSSILLIYDNDNSAPYMRWARALRKLHTIKPGLHISEDQISGLTRRTRVDVRMIDFAHTGALPAGMTRDVGYIRGLHTILKALKAIRVFRARPIFTMANAVVDVMEETRAHARSLESDDGVAREGFTFDTLLSELTPLSEQLSPQRCDDVACDEAATLVEDLHICSSPS